MVVREWVDQWKILRHACAKGFLSHCGWNSVLESVTAGVPLANRVRTTYECEVRRRWCQGWLV
jgi:hypothetical protein